MRLADTELPGVVVVDVEQVEDERGFFARTYAWDAFEERGLEPTVVECSLSYNHSAQTLRGLHYQTGDAAEAKLVRCVRGRMFDVAVDIRADSPHYLRWVGVELSEDNRRALYIPRGFAHGFVTLTDRTEVFYQISNRYVPAAAAGVRWDDPAVGVQWPVVPAVISARDRSFPLLG